MIGVDLTKISRFENIETDLILRVLSPKEVNDYKALKQDLKAKYIATRWAIKEAIFKADNKYSNFSKIYINKKEKVYSFKEFQISVSNEGDYIIAFVIII
ncbi:MAG: 4'-phosphopantetheinyl transferase superfamily protein [Metamycoplasmataceae bacterium]